jgi:hypothetical protein
LLVGLAPQNHCLLQVAILPLLPTLLALGQSQVQEFFLSNNMQQQLHIIHFFKVIIYEIISPFRKAYVRGGACEEVSEVTPGHSSRGWTQWAL